MRKQLQAVLFTVATVSLLAALMLLFTPTQSATAAVGGWEVVASNLSNPRHLTFDADGNLYIAEAGMGGDTCVNPDPENPDLEVCYGRTGAITKVTPDLTQSQMVSDLISLAIYFEPDANAEVTGPNGVTVDASGEVYAVVGLGAHPMARGLFGDEGMNLGQIVHVMDGSWMNVADVAAFELTNPTGDNVDSNPYDIHATEDGFLVADAGGNDVLMVSLDSMPPTIAAHTTFPTATEGHQAVPTSIAENAAGQYFVGQLTGFPFPVGAANVYHIMEGMDPMVHADGFTNITDVAFDEMDNLYVLEIAANGLLSGDPTGAIYQVAPDGTRTTILERPCTFNPADQALCAPAGLAVGPDGMLYVTNYSVIPGLAQVVRFAPDTFTTAVTVGGFAAAPSSAPLAPLALLTGTLSVGLLLGLRRRFRA